MTRRIAAGLAALLSCASLPLPAAAGAAAPELPGDSVLNLDGRFVDQAGRAFTLRERRGEAQIVGMFYASCQLVCPMLIETGRALDRALSAAERARLRVLLVSLDPAKDVPAVLTETAAKRGLDTHRWTLACTDADTVRRLAAVLDIRYRQLVDGNFNHTSALLLLDREGRIIARSDGLGGKPDPQFVAAVRAALAAHQGS